VTYNYKGRGELLLMNISQPKNYVSGWRLVKTQPTTGADSDSLLLDSATRSDMKK